MSSLEPETPSFERVLDEYREALWRMTYGYAEGEAERKDLFQDIVIALWQALPRFAGTSSLRTFVYRIGHNRGLSHRRYEERRHHTDVMSVVVTDPGPGPDELAETSIRRSRLQATIRRLRPALRQPLMMHLDGLPTGEIAEIMGVTPGNVFVRLSRARREVERLFDEVTADND